MGRHNGRLHPADAQILDVMGGYLEVPFPLDQTPTEKAEWLDANVGLHVLQAADKRRVAELPYDAEDLTPDLKPVDLNS